MYLVKKSVLRFFTIINLEKKIVKRLITYVLNFDNNTLQFELFKIVYYYT